MQIDGYELLEGEKREYGSTNDDQCVNGKWYRTRFGCDSLEMALDGVIQQILSLPEIQDEHYELKTGSYSELELACDAQTRNELRQELRQKITTLGEI